MNEGMTLEGRKETNPELQNLMHKIHRGSPRINTLITPAVHKAGEVVLCTQCLLDSVD